MGEILKMWNGGSFHGTIAYMIVEGELSGMRFCM
jgi:hypothetical protein